jgi:hypothetical protein
MPTAGKTHWSWSSTVPHPGMAIPHYYMQYHPVIKASPFHVDDFSQLKTSTYQGCSI